MGAAREAASRGLLKKAGEAVDRAIQAAPSDPRGYHLRAELAARVGGWLEAEVDYGRAIERAPQEPSLYMLRGTTRLRLGRFEPALSDFDRYAALRPSRASDLWQRGIVLFFLGRFDEGRRQFEVHRTVNPRDVENSAWHFACVAWATSAKAAEAGWLSVSGDPRVPMREIADLMSGRGSEEQVLAAAEAVTDPAQRDAALLYANLYLAMYHGAWRRPEPEARYIARASEKAAELGVMGAVALRYADWVTARMRGRGPAP